MRLSERERAIIVSALKRHFGDDSRVWLFGSRANDSARGGDIDLLVETNLAQGDDIVAAKLNALAEIHCQIGEQKIDLVIQRPGGPQLPIHRVARETGVSL